MSTSSVGVNGFYTLPLTLPLNGLSGNPGLEFLSLIELPIADEALTELLALPRLKHLALVGLPNLTQAGLDQLVRQLGPSVRVSVDNCPKIERVSHGKTESSSPSVSVTALARRPSAVPSQRVCQILHGAIKRAMRKAGFKRGRETGHYRHEATSRDLRIFPDRNRQGGLGELAFRVMLHKNADFTPGKLRLGRYQHLAELLLEDEALAASDLRQAIHARLSGVACQSAAENSTDREVVDLFADESSFPYRSERDLVDWGEWLDGVLARLFVS